MFSIFLLSYVNKYKQIVYLIASYLESFFFLGFNMGGGWLSILCNIHTTTLHNYTALENNNSAG
tara:strand:- start:804 stop:995 length:192 start_codon:yes stop_codon:yes gene_type:complete